jgi:hypothetical protein
VIYQFRRTIQFDRSVKNNVDTDPKAGAIEQVLIITDLWELLRDLTAGGQEHAIRHFPTAHGETITCQMNRTPT